MAQALQLAQSQQGKTGANPAVGALVVQQNMVIATGVTQRGGVPHAEPVALAAAGTSARGATLYVTLEPCCHHGKSPPCTEAIVKAGIRRVIVATTDKNPLVAGKGIEFLRSHGIEVSTGLKQKEADQLYEGFFFAVKHRRSWVSVKIAATLDGSLCDAQGHSKWITSAQSRQSVQRLRQSHCAIGTGAETLRRDNPRLSVRLSPDALQPLRLIFARQPDRLDPSLLIARDAAEVTTVIASPVSPQKPLAHVHYWQFESQSFAELFCRCMEKLFAQGYPTLLLEPGPRLCSLLLDANLINRLYIYYGNSIMPGGRNFTAQSNQRLLAARMQLMHPRWEVEEQNAMVTGLLPGSFDQTEE